MTKYQELMKQNIIDIMELMTIKLQGYNVCIIDQFDLEGVPWELRSKCDGICDWERCPKCIQKWVTMEANTR